MFSLCFFVCLKNPCHLLLHPTKIRAERNGQVALGSTKVLWMNSEPWIQVFTLPETDSQSPLKMRDSLEVWRGTYWKTIIFRFELLVSGRVVVFLGGETSNIYYFHTENWGRLPIWQAFFSDGLKPPTRNEIVVRSCCFFLGVFWSMFHHVSSIFLGKQSWCLNVNVVGSERYKTLKHSKSWMEFGLVLWWPLVLGELGLFPSNNKGPRKLQHIPIAHTPGNPRRQLWKASLYSLLVKA